jgi:hypothetical protein
MLVLLNDGGCPVAVNATPWDRLHARLRADGLDRALAAGASPDATVPLALRARALVCTRTRRGLAIGARRVLAAASQPPGPRRLPVPVCRDRVRDCSAELTELIGALLAAGPVSAGGVARAQALLSDARSPLYRKAAHDDLRERVRAAADALTGD